MMFVTVLPMLPAIPRCTLAFHVCPTFKRRVSGIGQRRRAGASGQVTRYYDTVSR